MVQACTALQYVAEFPKALKAAQAQQVKAGENPGALPNIRDSPEVFAQRIAVLLDSISTELENGSLVQLFVPRVDHHHQSGVVSLVTHKDLTRVNTVHNQKFWKYHEAGYTGVQFTPLSPPPTGYKPEPPPP